MRRKRKQRTKEEVTIIGWASNSRIHDLWSTKPNCKFVLPCPAEATARAWLTSGGDTTASSGRWSAPTRSWMLTRGWSLATSLGLIILQLIPITLWMKWKGQKSFMFLNQWKGTISWHYYYFKQKLLSPQKLVLTKPLELYSLIHIAVV